MVQILLGDPPTDPVEKGVRINAGLGLKLDGGSLVISFRICYALQLVFICMPARPNCDILSVKLSL